jgi:hypothetical protein
MISQTFRLGQTNWADIFFGISGIMAKLSALFWHCESLVHAKMDLIVFLTKSFGFQAQQIYVPNMILAVKNLGNSHHKSVVGA